ncbi:MAG: hypothetical protein K9I94_08675 [Bacteroidales bacterium]|nr:hypothetical protein [Bacteroidales bacterium]
MGRSILAIITGVIVGIIVIILIKVFGTFLYPANLAKNVGEATTVIESLPQAALFYVLAAWGLGSFAGGLVSALIAKNNGTTHALIVGFGLLLVGLLWVLAIPHPMWFCIVGLLVMLPFAYLGGEVPGKN